ncbi:MAG: GerAB/ArcD/ProY family transporter [Bacillota bacterium]
MSGSRKADGIGQVNHGRLDAASVGAISLNAIGTKAFLAYPAIMAKSAQTAAWIVPLASAILSFFWLAPLVYVLKKHPGKNFIEITQKLAGKPVAVILGAALYVFNFGIVATSSREIAEALATVILPLTPLSFTLAALSVTGLYVALKGTEVLGRLSLVTAAANIINIGFLSLLSYDAWSISRIQPLLGPGLPELAKTCVIRQVMYGEILSLGILAPYVRKTSDLGKTAVVSGALPALMLTLTVLSCLMMFPYPSLSEVPVPFLRVIRLVYLGRFFHRFDVFFVILWLSAGSLLIAAGSSINSQIAGTLWPKISYPAAVLATGGAAMVAALLIPSKAAAIILEFDIIRPYSIVLLYGWPVLLLILEFIRGKRRKPEGDLGDQAGA